MSNKSSAVRGNALSRSFSSDGSLKLFNESEVHGRQSLLIDSYPEHCIRLFPWWGRTTEDSIAQRNFVQHVVWDRDRVGVAIQRESAADHAELTLGNRNLFSANLKRVIDPFSVVLHDGQLDVENVTISGR